MGQIDWAVLGQYGGEAIEDFIAACLTQRYKSAQQVKPGRGDGGIDVWRRTRKGITNWQIKKFTSPLTESQWAQVEKSWNRFLESWPDKGHVVKKWYLVTPWTPTLGALERFDRMTAGKGFPTHWSGGAFIDGLASEFPATYSRYFKGDDFLENMVMQKAVLAGLPLEKAESISMLEAIASKEADLDALRQLVSDNYNVDHGYITTTGGLPFPDANSVGVMHRYTYLGDHRYRYETVVPKTSQAGEIEPISVSFQFNVIPGSEDEQAILEWQNWGVPFTDISAMVKNSGGPLADDEAQSSLVSFVQPPAELNKPDLLLRAEREGTRGPVLRLRTIEVSRGSITGWTRVIATSPSGIVRLESRLGEQEKGSQLNFSLQSIQGRVVSDVIQDLEWVEQFISVGSFVLEVDEVGVLASGSGGSVPELATIFVSIAKALSKLQHATLESLSMPDLSEVTEREYRDLMAWADIFSGIPQTGVWGSREFRKPPEDHEEAATMREMLDQGSASLAFFPRVRLAGREIQMNKRVVQTVTSFKLSGNKSYEELPVGELFEVVPDDNDEVVTAAVIDDELQTFQND